MMKKQEKIFKNHVILQRKRMRKEKRQESDPTIINEDEEDYNNNNNDDDDDDDDNAYDDHDEMINEEERMEVNELWKLSSYYSRIQLELSTFGCWRVVSSGLKAFGDWANLVRDWVKFRDLLLGDAAVLRASLGR